MGAVVMEVMIWRLVGAVEVTFVDFQVLNKAMLLVLQFWNGLFSITTSWMGWISEA